MSRKKKFSNEKMNDKELREVAKQRGVRGYSKMPKAKLITAVHETEKQRKSDFYKPQALLNNPVPDLQEPTKAEPISFAERIKHKLSEYKSDFTRRVEVSLSRVKS